MERWRKRWRQLGRVLASTNALELSNSGWHQNNRKQKESMVSETHILYSSVCIQVCGLFLFCCWSPAASEGGIHVRGRTARVSFQDQQHNSRDIMSFSVATLPVTAPHLPHRRNLVYGSLWQTVCLLQCVRMRLLSQGELRPGQMR